MNHVIKIIKPLEDSVVLIEGVAERVKQNKETRRRISWRFVTKFSGFISQTSNFFCSKRYKWKKS